IRQDGGDGQVTVRTADGASYAFDHLIVTTPQAPTTKVGAPPAGVPSAPRRPVPRHALSA
ncbi:hypothetical protein ACWD3Z_06135, partial [Streptomyces sp. NPDC002740]